MTRYWVGMLVWFFAWALTGYLVGVGERELRRGRPRLAGFVVALALELVCVLGVAAGAALMLSN